MPNGPFTDEDLRRIDRGIAAANEALAGADRAQRADINVEAIIARAREEKRRLLAIRDEYFSGRATLT